MKYARLIAGVIGGYSVLADLVIVGSMAASGGYYLASAGDVIYADAAGIVELARAK